MKSGNTKQIFGWTMYDWANSAFATTVMAGFFPIFFEKYWSNPNDVAQSTFYLGWANSIASIIIAAIAPFLGSIADRGTAKKKFLMTFAVLGIVMSGGLWIVGQGQWQMAALLYVLASIGFAGGNIFYDSLLTGVGDEREIDFVSSLGFALGYIGGGLLFLINVIMYLKPELFGFIDNSVASIAREINGNNISFEQVKIQILQLNDSHIDLKNIFTSSALSNEELLSKVSGLLSAASAIAIKYSFLSVAVWWAVFSVPIFLFVKEPVNYIPIKFSRAITLGWQQLLSTFKEIKHLKVVALFLLAYWFYIDGVDTIIKMAVKYGSTLGFKSSDLITALLIVQFVAFPAALLYHVFAKKIGVKQAIMVAIGGYSVITLFGSLMTKAIHFYILAILIGLFQGGIQALSRSLYTRIIPKKRSAEFFGFYNMLGKFAAVLGPPLMGTITLLTNSPRLGILSVLLLFICGGFLLSRVDIEEGRKKANDLANI